MSGNSTASLNSSSGLLADSPAECLRAELREHLLDLSYRAYAECIRQLMAEMGYTDVVLTDRTHRRGRTRKGGRDLEAHLATGLSASRVVLQLKQYGRPVQRRFVDELRGMMARTGAAHGLIVTTSQFPRGARESAQSASASGLLPVRLVDGEELLNLLIVNRVGVRLDTDGAPALDADFFADLARRYPPSPAERRQRPTGISATSQPALRSAPTPATANPSGGYMVWQTHLVSGIGSLWVLSLLPNGVPASQAGALAVVAAFGALLPDLDSTSSKLATAEIAGVRPFIPIAAVAHGRFGHRGFLHSCGGLAVVVALTVPVAIWLDWRVAAALSLGYASHLTLDAMTKTGIPGLRGAERLHLLPMRWRLRTGSPPEEIIFVLAALAALLFLLVHLPRS